MSDGEDRHFCARAENLHIPMYADPWPDIYHAYHPQEYPKIQEQLFELERSQQSRPAFGDLVSAKLETLEPVADQTGRQFMLGPKWIRGKLGVLNILPEAEEAIGGLSVGESQIIRLHYPSNYKVTHMSNQTRLARVTLFDAKPFRIAPVVDRETFVGTYSRRIIDHTTLTDEQLHDIAQGARGRTVGSAGELDTPSGGCESDPEAA